MLFVTFSLHVKKFGINGFFNWNIFLNTGVDKRGHGYFFYYGRSTTSSSGWSTYAVDFLRVVYRNLKNDKY